MRFTALFAFVCLALIMGCTKKVSPSTSPATDNGVVKMVDFGEVVSLAPGETAKIEKTQAVVTFIDVESDSRCPRGVNCVTEGEAFVLISLGNSSARNKVRIDVDPQRTSRLTMTDATIEFLGLDPYPDARVKIDPAQRRLRVRMIKSSKM